MLNKVLVVCAMAMGAVGCAADTSSEGGSAPLVEQRGPFTIEFMWLDHGDALADVFLTATGESVVQLACDERGGFIEVSAPTFETAGRTPLSGGATCANLDIPGVSALIGRDILSSLPTEVPFDDAGCDVIGGDSICCAKHDACFAAHDCSAWSWGNVLNPFSKCGGCNREVVWCMATH